MNLKPNNKTNAEYAELTTNKVKGCLLLRDEDECECWHCREVWWPKQIDSALKRIHLHPDVTGQLLQMGQSLIGNPGCHQPEGFQIGETLQMNHSRIGDLRPRECQPGQTGEFCEMNQPSVADPGFIEFE